MHIYRILTRLLISGTVATALITGVFLTLPAASAAPVTVFVNPHIESKLMLPQTSIDGPALWTSATGAIRAEIAYTGSDVAHSLNVMTSTDGIHFGNKYVLNDTSFVRPALARFGSGASDNIALAWTGTDTNHSLNILVGVPGRGYTKITLKDNSFTAPAVTIQNNELYLAWAGTDPGHALNIAHVVWRGGMYVDRKTILWQFHSAGRPNLTFDPNGNQLLLSWPVAGTNRIAFATSTDGVHFTIPSTSSLAEWTFSGPHMVGLPVNNMPRYFLGWTGTDASHRVNVQYTESFPRWPDVGATKSTFSETALGGPALGYVGVANRVILVWAGTDTAHHLNVAVVSVGR
jgi:hypothetical protein